MGLIRLIVEQRDRVILSRVHPHLASGEEVLHWARTRIPGSRREGFVFLTHARCVVHWGGEEQENIPLTEVRSWGVKEQSRGGPILGVETDVTEVFIQFPVDSHRRARRTSDFLVAFAERAPWPVRALSSAAHADEYAAHHGGNRSREKKPISAHARRVAITVVGLVLVVAGIVLMLPFVPGPGIVVLITGLAVLATEYDWAKDAVEWVRERYRATKRKIESRRHPGR